MQIDDFTKKTIGVAIVLLTIASVAVPIISDLSVGDEITMENTGAVATFDRYDSNNKIEINGSASAYDVKVSINDGPEFKLDQDGKPLVITNKFIVSKPSSGNRMMIVGNTQYDVYSTGANTIATWSSESDPADVYFVRNPDNEGAYSLMTNGEIKINTGQEIPRSGTLGPVFYNDPDDLLIVMMGGNLPMTGSQYGVFYNLKTSPPTSYGSSANLSNIRMDTNITTKDGHGCHESVISYAYELIDEDMSGCVENILTFIIVPTQYSYLTVDDTPTMQIIQTVPIIMIAGVVMATVAAFLTYKLKED